jgi:hypothetical protein
MPTSPGELNNSWRLWYRRPHVRHVRQVLSRRSTSITTPDCAINLSKLFWCSHTHRLNENPSLAGCIQRVRSLSPECRAPRLEESAC